MVPRRLIRTEPRVKNEVLKCGRLLRPAKILITIDVAVFPTVDLQRMKKRTCLTIKSWNLEERCRIANTPSHKDPRNVPRYQKTSSVNVPRTVAGVVYRRGMRGLASLHPFSLLFHLLSSSLPEILSLSEISVCPAIYPLPLPRRTHCTRRKCWSFVHTSWWSP